MSIIAISGIPNKWRLDQCAACFEKLINGKFEPINFKMQKGKATKTCYMKLSKKLDTLQVVERITKKFRSKNKPIEAFIPNQVPDFQLPLKKQSKGVTPAFDTMERPEQVLIITHTEIMRELQTKYTGLYALSKKYGHKLLESLAKLICERLKVIVETNPTACEGPCQLSKAYRTVHPHFADFQCILTSLHHIESEAKKPKTQVLESDIMTISASPYVLDNVPFNKVRQASIKYTEKISNVFAEHTKLFDVSIRSKTDSEEEIARKKVKVELAKLAPHMEMIIRQVIMKHLAPERTTLNNISIYGDPYLPWKEMKSFSERHHVDLAKRSRRIYNLLKVQLPSTHYGNLMAMDGTIIGGAKLIIRRADVELYKIPQSVVADMKAVFGVDHNNQDNPVDSDEDWLDEIVDDNK